MATLLLTCGVNAGLGLAVTYVVFHRWVADGLDQFELSLIGITSAFIFFAIVVAFDTWALSYYRREQTAEGKKVRKFGYLLLLLGGGTIVASGLIDALFYVFDNSLSATYGEAIGNLAEQSGLPMTAEEIDSFIHLPFFLQNIAVNSVGIIIGVLLSIPLSKALLKVTTGEASPV